MKKITRTFRTQLSKFLNANLPFIEIIEFRYLLLIFGHKLYEEIFLHRKEISIHFHIFLNQFA